LEKPSKCSVNIKLNRGKDKFNFVSHELLILSNLLSGDGI
jgi:hypothetical protein